MTRCTRWDAMSGTQLWQASAIGANETAADNQGCSELPAKVGITATPVIDRNFGPDGAIYLRCQNEGQRRQLSPAAARAGSDDRRRAERQSGGHYGDHRRENSFDPGISVERAALLVNNGIVYLSWAAPCHQTTFGL